MPAWQCQKLPILPILGLFLTPPVERVILVISSVGEAVDIVVLPPLIVLIRLALPGHVRVN